MMNYNGFKQTSLVAHLSLRERKKNQTSSYKTDTLKKKKAPREVHTSWKVEKLKIIVENFSIT